MSDKKVRVNNISVRFRMDLDPYLDAALIH